MEGFEEMNGNGLMIQSYYNLNFFLNVKKKSPTDIDEGPPDGGNSSGEVTSYECFQLTTETNGTRLHRKGRIVDAENCESSV